MHKPVSGWSLSHIFTTGVLFESSVKHMQQLFYRDSLLRSIDVSMIDCGINFYDRSTSNLPVSLYIISYKQSIYKNFYNNYN